MNFRFLTAISLYAWLSLHSRNCSAEQTLAVELASDVLGRQLVVEDGQLRTLRLVHKKTGSTLHFPGASSAEDEFQIRLHTGPLLSTKDYRVVAHKTSRIQAEQREIFSLEPLNSAYPRLTIEYVAGERDHFLRKRMTVTGNSVVDSIAVESHSLRVKSVGGGFGQPLFWDDTWFGGLEYPAGMNELSDGRLTMTHFPGKETFTSQWAILGSSAEPNENSADGFADYLGTIRLPSRPSLQYNGWFDLRGSEVTPARLEQTLRIFEQKLLRPFGLAFDAFVIDHGYENPSTLWECNEHWPQGMAPFARRLRESGSRLGLWLPLNGYHLNQNLGKNEGWARSNHRKACFCLADPKFQLAMRLALRQRIQDGNVAYFKHDFNFLACSQEGHNHLPTDRHGREANVDAQIELLSHERELQPDIFLNVTSNIWPSPWWLAHCDTLWMGDSDYAEEWSSPQSGNRAAEMTFKDDRLYRLLRMNETPIPASALMTHGIIRGRYEAADPKESLREWSDYVMMYFGRGTMLHELYVSPDLMPEEFWPVLGNAIRWARDNTDTFAHTRMVGGSPLDSLYGYVHWSTKKGIVCLRNPTQKPVEYSLTLDERPRSLPAQKTWHPIVIYPCRERLAAMESQVDSQHAITVPAESVMVIELWSDLPEVLASLPLGRFDMDNTGRRVTYALPTPLQVRRSEPLVQDKKVWEVAVSCRKERSVLERALVVVQRPASGGSIHWEPEEASAIVTKSNHGPDWSLTKYALDKAGDLEGTLKVSLPPTPFFPQQTSTTAVLTTRRNLAVAEENVLSAGTKTPHWPIAPDAGVDVEQFVLIDNAVLARRRSAPESFGWVIVLGAVPFGIAGYAAHKFTSQRSFGSRGALFLILATALAGLYYVTPLGVALSRALSEASLF